MKTNVEETRYGLRVELPVSYERAVEQATAALKAQGFGVLTTIDVQQTLKQKLQTVAKEADARLRSALTAMEAAVRP